MRTTPTIAITLVLAWLTTALLQNEPASKATAAEQSDKPLKLFSSQDEKGEFAGWKSFHEDGAKTGTVWKLDDEGVLACKGTPKGYLYTERDYGNFVLRLQWRWPQGKKPGKGGVLLRTTGKHKIWPKSLEAQINAGDAGDFWGLDGYRLDGPAERLKSFDNPKFGKLTGLKKSLAAEKSPGQWNQYEIVADGATVILKINGKEVNRATGCDPAPGKIVLTSEGNEIHFRNVQLSEIK